MQSAQPIESKHIRRPILRLTLRDALPGLFVASVFPGLSARSLRFCWACLRCFEREGESRTHGITTCCESGAPRTFVKEDSRPPHLLIFSVDVRSEGRPFESNSNSREKEKEKVNKDEQEKALCVLRVSLMRALCVHKATERVRE